MRQHDLTGLTFPGMREGSEAAYQFLHCDKNDEWTVKQHTPESLIEASAKGHECQYCRFCGLPLMTRIVESVFRYGRIPLQIVEWP